MPNSSAASASTVRFSGGTRGETEQALDRMYPLPGLPTRSRSERILAHLVTRSLEQRVDGVDVALEEDLRAHAPLRVGQIHGAQRRRVERVDAVEAGGHHQFQPVADLAARVGVDRHALALHFRPPPAVRRAARTPRTGPAK